MRTSRLLAGATILSVGTIFAGVAHAVTPAKTASLPNQSVTSVQPTVANDRGIRLGSIGSGLFRARTDAPNEFYMVTDRGPNGQPDDKRTFPVPDFDPTIVKVRVWGEQIQILERIPLKTTSGAPVTGLPNFPAVTSPLSPTAPMRRTRSTASITNTVRG